VVIDAGEFPKLNIDVWVIQDHVEIAESAVN